MRHIDLLVNQIKDEYFKSKVRRNDKLCDCNPKSFVTVEDKGLRCPICRRKVEIEIIEGE